MSPKYFLLLLSVNFVVEIVSGTTTVVPSSTVQTSGLPATSSAIFTALPIAISTVVGSPSLSSVNTASTSPVEHSVLPTSAVQPSSTSSPSSSSVSPVTTATQPTKQPTTSDLSAQVKTIGGMEIMGFAILTILGIMIITFAIYYFFFREQMYPEYLKPLTVHANGQAPAEAGITHTGFVGDAESPAKVAAPEPEVKVVIGPEVTPEVKGNEGPEDSAL